MDELSIPKQFAYCRELKNITNDPQLRVYKNSPDLLAIQVRTRAGIGTNGGGAPRNMIAGVEITRAEAAQLIAALREFIQEKP